MKVSKIAKEDIQDFYYTYNWIGFNAEYQRYRFYLENGKHYFFHETRGTKDNYGWNEEGDTTAKGTMALNDQEWSAFYDLIKDGEVEERKEHLEDGDAGPWFYLYWKGDRGNIQEYAFPSLGAQREFESYCKKLREETPQGKALGKR